MLFARKKPKKIPLKINANRRKTSKKQFPLKINENQNPTFLGKLKFRGTTDLRFEIADFFKPMRGVEGLEQFSGQTLPGPMKGDEINSGRGGGFSTSPAGRVCDCAGGFTTVWGGLRLCGTIYRCTGGFMIVREGLRLYGRVCDCSGGFATVREGLRLCGRVCDCGFAAVREVCDCPGGFASVREGLRVYGRVYDCTGGFATVLEGLRLCGGGELYGRVCG